MQRCAATVRAYGTWAREAHEQDEQDCHVLDHACSCVMVLAHAQMRQEGRDDNGMDLKMFLFARTLINQIARAVGLVSLFHVSRRQLTCISLLAAMAAHSVSTVDPQVCHMSTSRQPPA